MQRFSSTILSLKDLTPTVRQFVCSAPSDFTFLPGQFVNIFALGTDGKKTARSYSIASSPERKGTLEFCIKTIPGGIASPYLFARQIGDELEIRGPMGSFILRDTTRDLVFISIGTGIAPFRSMIQSLIASGFSKEIILLNGARYPQEILYEEEWKELASTYPHFVHHPIISKPHDGYHGNKGYVQDLVKNIIPHESNAHFYLCGLWDMIHDVKTLLLSKGIKEQQIIYERYD